MCLVPVACIAEVIQTRIYLRNADDVRGLPNPATRTIIRHRMTKCDKARSSKTSLYSCDMLTSGTGETSYLLAEKIRSLTTVTINVSVTVWVFPIANQLGTSELQSHLQSREATGETSPTLTVLRARHHCGARASKFHKETPASVRKKLYVESDRHCSTVSCCLHA